MIFCHARVTRCLHTGPTSQRARIGWLTVHRRIEHFRDWRHGVGRMTLPRTRRHVHWKASRIVTGMTGKTTRVISAYNLKVSAKIGKRRSVQDLRQAAARKTVAAVWASVLFFFWHGVVGPGDWENIQDWNLYYRFMLVKSHPMRLDQ